LAFWVFILVLHKYGFNYAKYTDYQEVRL